MRACVCVRKSTLLHFRKVVSTMVRVGVRLGLKRRPRDVTPSLGEYLSARSFEDGEVTIEGEVNEAAE